MAFRQEALSDEEVQSLPEPVACFCQITRTNYHLSTALQQACVRNLVAPWVRVHRLTDIFNHM